jgi:hypothetical protein
VILNTARNNANENGHREFYLPVIFTDQIQLRSLAVEAILACCAACFTGCIESIVGYFNRFVSYHFFVQSLNFCIDMLTLKSVRVDDISISRCLIVTNSSLR